MKSKSSISKKSLSAVSVLTSLAHFQPCTSHHFTDGEWLQQRSKIQDSWFVFLLRGALSFGRASKVEDSSSDQCAKITKLQSRMWWEAEPCYLTFVGFFHQERRGGSLERMGREPFHLGGAAGEDHSSVSKRYVEHPIPILQQQQVLPRTRGWDVKSRSMKHRS